jgi:dihydrofolate reductase
MLNLIFCVDNNGLFGRKNKLPWNFKEDLKYFKDITTNFNKNLENDNILVMGYNTWLSIDKKLPNRVNVVISSKKEINTKSNIPDYIFENFNEFLLKCKKGNIFYNRNIFIIGGKKLLSYIIFNYNKLIKYVFMNIIDYSFPQFLDDVMFKLHDYNNFNIIKLSTNTIYCLNNFDDKYYYIKFNQMLNNNFDIKEVIKLTDNISNNSYGIGINNNSYGYINNNHNTHNEYTILEDIYDTPLQYCKECDSIIKQQVIKNQKYIVCNDCIDTKCKCLLC